MKIFNLNNILYSSLSNKFISLGNEVVKFVFTPRRGSQSNEI